MALKKRFYVDGQTVINAQNLNDIQDEVIRVAEEQAEDQKKLEPLSKGAANTINGSVSGAVVRVDDVSPLMPELAVQLVSKNLIPYPYAETPKTKDGVTFSVLNDGGVRVSGTAAINTSYTLARRTSQNLSVKKGKAYTFTVTSTLNTSRGYVFFQVYEGETLVQSVSAHNESTTFTAKVDGYVSVGIVLMVGQTFDEVMYVQAEEGNVATAYTPYLADLSAASVNEYGKNLLDLTKASKGQCTYNAQTGEITSNINNHYYCSVTVTYLNDLLLANKGKAFTFSFAGTPTGYCNIVLSGTRTDGSTYSESKAGTNKTTIIVHETFTTITSVALRFNRSDKQRTDTASVFTSFQFEMGENATEYEPYKSPTPHLADEAGVVDGLISDGSTMTLVADKGATIMAEYNKDTNKVITALLERISALEAAAVNNL